MEVCYSVYAHTITVGDSRYSYGGIVMVATYSYPSQVVITTVQGQRAVAKPRVFP